MTSKNTKKLLKEFVDLTMAERRMREADVSDGSRVPHGSKKHIKDLEGRISALEMWRGKQKRGSEARANYTRLIARLKGELASARRAAAKATIKENYATEPEPEQLQKWQKLASGETPDEHVNHAVKSFAHAGSLEELDRLRDELLGKIARKELSSACSRGFVNWLYRRTATRFGVEVHPLKV